MLTILGSRGSGKTTALLAVAILDAFAVIVCADKPQAIALMRVRPDLRAISWHEFVVREPEGEENYYIDDFDGQFKGTPTERLDQAEAVGKVVRAKYDRIRAYTFTRPDAHMPRPDAHMLTQIALERTAAERDGGS